MLGGKGLRAATFFADAVMRHLGNRILCDPAALERKLEERRKDAAPVVVRLHAGLILFQKFRQGGRRDFRDRLARERLGQPL